MLGLGLGLGRGGSLEAGPLPSKVLYERDGNWLLFDVFDFGAVNCTATFTTALFAGTSNHLKITSTTTGSDGIVHLDKAALDGDLDDYYAAKDEGGSFRFTIDFGFPSSNTDTATVSTIRTRIGTTSKTQAGPAKDVIDTVVQNRSLGVASDPSLLADYIKFEFEDPTTGQPVGGDLMYVKRFKFEYIAA